MKLSLRQLLLLIVALFVIAAPVLAQTSASPTTVAVAGDPNMALPDAPNPAPPSAVPHSPRPYSAVRPVAEGEQLMDRNFLLVSGVMFGATIANVELTHRCLQNGACSLVPSGLRSRGALYGVSLPVDAGIMLLGRYLKGSEHHWWYVPAAIVTGGNVGYAIHASQYMR